MKTGSSALVAELRAAGRRSWTPTLIRGAVTLSVLAALLAWLPIATLVDAMTRLSPLSWLGALLAFAAGHVLAALKWRQLVRASGVAASIAESVRAHGAGLFANLCLPSLVGGDLLRAGLLIRRHGSAEAIGVASVADRVLDTVALLVLAAIGAASISTSLDPALGRVLLGVATLLGCTLGAAVLGAWLVLPRLTPESLPTRLAAVFERIERALAALRARPALAASCLALSVGIQACFVALNAALGKAIGLELAFAVWLLAWPLAKLVALAPVSLGGMGVREVALAGLLLPFGVEPVLAVGQSLVWETLLIGLGIAAGIGAFWLAPIWIATRADGSSPPGSEDST